MRISDWSSDVCSSDLNLASDAGTTQRVRGRRAYVDRYAAWRDGARPHREQAILAALKAALILAENAGALPKQHDAAIIGVDIASDDAGRIRSEEHTSELQSLMRTSYAVF